ncbi:hypothetical protein [Fructilactobacillus sanfranciscensis]|nr:hypothetical protein [Fructilactobacillus sanfranciscensis]KRM81232.1 hypothetical protein FD36_GL000129 [Fructilactobacillus sanfranciscensis DSM 20451]MCG7194075.1 hypothetical protein [Fructilactobacillus sanfranciscensis]MCG7195336.1 hypothetical protein [Fructilactobacillus sanfranciscensis]MDN4461611.1 hypothetical protein [Fructilactobacillus sanfranciscensis]MVF15298.1 hypothetical protein [Fructilactobacillus sanfranciscensis]
MAFNEVVRLKGDDHQYQLSSELKLFTLSDLGFTKTRNGNFEFKRSLDPNSPYLKKSIKLKVMIKQDLKSFKLSVVDGSELKEVDIFSTDKYENERTQFDFLMDNFILRKVFIKS